MSDYLSANYLLFPMENPPIQLCLQRAVRWSDVILDEMLVSWANDANKSWISFGKQLNLRALCLRFPN